MMATLPKAKPSVISVSNLHMPFHIPGEASKRPTHNNSNPAIDFFALRAKKPIRVNAFGIHPGREKIIESNP